MKNSILGPKIKLLNLIIGTKSNLRGYLIVFGFLALSAIISIININGFVATGSTSHIEIFGKTVVFEGATITDNREVFDSSSIGEEFGWNLLVQTSLSFFSMLMALVVLVIVSYYKTPRQGYDLL